jgi:gliding motility-associated protein GldC
MKQSSIDIDIVLDAEKVPEQISWSTTDIPADKKKKAKAMILSFWDGEDKTALRIDLWTKDMMVDEMSDFFYQTFMTLSETYGRATRQTELVNDMKKFAKDFYDKSRELQLKDDKMKL